MQLLWQFCVIPSTNISLKKKKQSLRTCRVFFICSTFQGGRSCATRRLPKTLDLYWSFQFYHTLFSGINNICRNLCSRLTQKHWIDSILLSSYNQNITFLHLGSDKKTAYFVTDWQIGIKPLVLSQLREYALDRRPNRLPNSATINSCVAFSALSVKGLWYSLKYFRLPVSSILTTLSIKKKHWIGNTAEFGTFRISNFVVSQFYLWGVSYQIGVPQSKDYFAVLEFTSRS